MDILGPRFDDGFESLSFVFKKLYVDASLKVVQQFYITSMNSECNIMHSWNLGCLIQGSDIVFAQNMLVW
jgi:hypothetical protein